ncbi:hypothetical protein CRYUN_Cryun16bG0088800 [Craigia yunnanensis]
MIQLRSVRYFSEGGVEEKARKKGVGYMVRPNQENPNQGQTLRTDLDLSSIDLSSIMVKILLKLSSTVPFLLTILSFFSTFASIESKPFSRNLSQSSQVLKREKLSHLQFYFHDMVAAKNPTAIRVAQAPTTSASSPFGAVVMIDDPLTIKPDINSKLVGKAQGIYALASQTDASLLMLYNFAFMEGKYNGSNLSVLGRNSVFSSVRELPVVGGRGVFRFARGYTEARTHTYDPKTGNAVVEYNVYVFHY